MLRFLHGRGGLHDHALRLTPQRLKREDSADPIPVIGTRAFDHHRELVLYCLLMTRKKAAEHMRIVGP